MYYSPFNQFQNYSIRQESITRVTGEEGTTVQDGAALGKWRI
nr:MAG TPA: hypothetical protein [Caudoviricetes sp.]